MSKLDILNTFIYIALTALIVVYFLAFYAVFIKRSRWKRFLRFFYNSICSIYSEASNSSISEKTSADWFEQLNLNYEKLCQNNPNHNYDSILDVLETITHYYDSYSDGLFKEIFQHEKNHSIRDFIMEMCQYIKGINPFISIPKKEADLMQLIAKALEENNENLGLTSLKQLSQEILMKEKLIVKKERDNQIATIISVVGIILTVCFGFLSLFQLKH